MTQTDTWVGEYEKKINGIIYTFDVDYSRTYRIIPSTFYEPATTTDGVETVDIIVVHYDENNEEVYTDIDCFDSLVRDEVLDYAKANAS